MRVGVLGASGRTGALVVEQALAAGHQVLALVRSPEKITTRHESLKVHKIDLFDEGSLVVGFTGCDVIVSCLGPATYRWTQWNVTFYSETTKIITSALRKSDVSRFIFMSSAFAKKTSGEPFLVWGFLRPVFLGAVLRDLARAEDFLMSLTPNIKITIVKPPGLSQDPLDDREILTQAGAEFVPGAASMMTRSHVAKFMVNVLTNETWDNKYVAIAVANPPNRNN